MFTCTSMKTCLEQGTKLCWSSQECSQGKEITGTITCSLAPQLNHVLRDNNAPYDDSREPSFVGLVRSVLRARKLQVPSQVHLHLN